jgi:GT2 family glycosyltransferase
MEVSASIVAYKTPKEELLKVSTCFLNSKLAGKLYVVDNSPIDTLRGFCDDARVEYIHNPSNPGFGAAHNIAIDLATKAGSNYHFVINPDIYFDGDVITPMVNYMEANKEIGMMMPRVLYPDGSIQYLPKLLPSPFWIFKRKFKFLAGSYKKFIGKYELRDIDPQLIYNSPILSGCFSMLRLDVIKELGSFDDRYFMYFEDFDLSRRVHQKYKTIYYPLVSVYHGYEREANKSIKLFKIFIQSMILYFNKWGWAFDKERKEINDRTLAQFE